MRTRKTTVLLVALALLAVPAAVLASHDFQDVPTDEFYHEPVSEIHEARVTAGCNAEGTEYCPDDPTTRGQMATFLSAGMGRVAFSQGNAFVPVAGTSSANATEINSVIIEAGGGQSGGTAYISLDAGFVVEATGATTATEVTLELRGAGQASGQYRTTVIPATMATASGVVIWVVPVDTASSNEFTLVAWVSSGASTVRVRGDVKAFYAPFNTEQPGS